MTAVQRRGVQAEQLFLIGTQAQVRQQLARLAADGRLEAKAPATIAGREHTVPVWVIPEPEQPKMSAKTKVIAAGATAGVGLVALVGWEVYELVSHYYVYIFGGLAALVVGTVVVWLLKSRDCDVIHIRR